MASNKDFAQFIADQFDQIDGLVCKRMFGEFGVFSNNKIFALICDNKLFIKPTKSGKDFIGKVVEASPYPGAKNSFLIEDRIEDKAWLTQLAKITISELPEPKPKKKKLRD